MGDFIVTELPGNKKARNVRSGLFYQFSFN